MTMIATLSPPSALHRAARCVPVGKPGADHGQRLTVWTARTGFVSNDIRLDLITIFSHTLIQ